MEGMFYLCSKNKGADQLHVNCAADLHLCFGICIKQVFSWPSWYDQLRDNYNNLSLSLC